MRSRLLSILFLAAACQVLPVTPASAQVPIPAPPSLNSESYVLMDYTTGKHLVSVNPDERLEPASITKLMTLYVAFQALEEGKIALDDQVLISEKAWRTGGSRMYIEVDKRVSVEDLLRGVIVQSGNDASVALAEHVAGSEETFVSLMNAQAQSLGLTNSHFVNATGWPAQDHYMTAADIAHLSAAVIRDFPDFYEWFSEKEFSFNDISQFNRNRLLWRDPSVDGLKTGHTEAAGYCLASSARQNDMRLISVVMQADSDDARLNDSQKLLTYGFRFFEPRQLFEDDEVLATREVWKGETDSVQVAVADNQPLLLPRDAQLQQRVDLPNHFQAPIAQGQKLGEVVVMHGDEEVARRDLVALNEVAEGGFFKRMSDSVKLWFVDD